MKKITVERLSQLKALKREIAAEKHRLKRVRELATYGHSTYGSVHVQGGFVADKTGIYAAEITYLQQLIGEGMNRAICELLRLEKFISDIEDSDLRIIFRERYIKGKNWQAIAMMMESCDEQLPRRRHDRYIEKKNKEALEVYE
ncbi:MAG: hypothetical protein RSE36_06590 [Oscillospiraceae bacterium]